MLSVDNVKLLWKFHYWSDFIGKSLKLGSNARIIHSILFQLFKWLFLVRNTCLILQRKVLCVVDNIKSLRKIKLNNRFYWQKGLFWHELHVRVSYIYIYTWSTPDIPSLHKVICVHTYLFQHLQRAIYKNCRCGEKKQISYMNSAPPSYSSFKQKFSFHVLFSW